MAVDIADFHHLNFLSFIRSLTQIPPTQRIFAKHNLALRLQPSLCLFCRTLMMMNESVPFFSYPSSFFAFNTLPSLCTVYAGSELWSFDFDFVLLRSYYTFFFLFLPSFLCSWFLIFVSIVVATVSIGTRTNSRSFFPCVSAF